MSTIEIIAVILGATNILLVAQRSIWNFPAALVMVALYARIFWDAKLYSDAGLQGFFFAVNLYGWWSWRAHKADAGKVMVERLDRTALFAWMGGSIVAVLGWGMVMARLTDASLPYADASVAMLSVAAQLLMTWRKLENWYWWIVINIISVGLYAAKGLYLTMGLYAVFLVLAVWGLINWRRSMRA
ncbi:MAG: nicotinamide riboside transporter PnuC [Pseudomonadota bacterium]